MSQILRFLGLAAALLGTISAAQAKPQAADAARNPMTVPNGGPLSVPRLVQFNGTLKDTGARAISGVASVTFAIYDEQDGGTALWSETQNVPADANGHFSVLLGAATAAGVPAELFGTGQSRWLGVTVARQQEMPRVLLASVPYALKAADADTLGGLPASAYVMKSAQPLTPGSTAILAGPEVASTSLSAAPAAVSQATTPTGGGTTNYIPKWTSATALGNSILFQNGSNIGIGTITPTETLDVNGNSIFRGSFQLPPGHPATSASGFESHSFQFQASSFNSGTNTSNTEAFGFRAEPLNNNTTNPSAKLDLFFGAGGSAPFTDTGLSFAANGIITFAPGQTFPTQSANVNELVLPNTTSSTSGVITMGGVPFVSNPGVQNSFFGASAGAPFTTTGFGNTAVGYNSLSSDTNGGDNTSVGDSALTANTTGGSNVAIGELALFSNSSGSGNTAVGAGAGTTNSSGSSNTLLGSGSNVAVDGLTNATAIGANSFVFLSNTMVLGSVKGYNSATTNTLVGIGTVAPMYPLEVDGDAGAIYAESANVGVAAIYGFATASSGDSVGGHFYTDSSEGSGLVGINGSGSGYAGEFLGDVMITGKLTKGSGSFKIDDPIDPANKYLSHSFVESPDMMNIYNGIAVLDAHGRAQVQMPEWFAALNQDFRYTLTAIGAPGPRLYIAREIHDNRFSIAGGKSGLKVSWMVTGIRHDAYANAHRIPTEETKPPSEQGRYLHPELFGAGPDKAIFAAKPGLTQPDAPQVKAIIEPEHAKKSQGATD